MTFCVVPNTEHQQINTTMLNDIELEGATNSEKEKNIRNIGNDGSYEICCILFIS